MKMSMNRRYVCRGLVGLVAISAAAGASVSIASAQPLLLEVSHAEVINDARTNAPVVAFRLSDASRRLFAVFTTENVGRMVEIRVDGKAFTRPVIREPILGGAGQISGMSSVKEATDVAARLSAGTGRLEIEAVLD
jgi:preprotein translocase subunit SecD